MQVVSSQNAVDIAKEVIQPLLCEWGDRCKAALNSWQALQEHLQLHLVQAKERGSFDCHFNKCAFRLQESFGDLQRHVELSHLSRVVLPCPVEGCSEGFARHNQLPGHINDHYSHSRHISSTSGLENQNLPLKLLHRPFAPHFAPLLPLDRDCTRTYLFYSRRVARARRHLVSAPSASQVARKWSRLTAQDAAPTSDSDDAPQAFPVLPTLPELADYDTFTDFIVRRKPPEPELQLSRPAPTFHPPFVDPPPPRSMGYEAFKARYQVLEDAGFIDGSGVWPEDREREESL